MTVVPFAHKGIPTTYCHINMRSRLEARWAAFFDLCGWRWEYEPIDEIGWVPDFLLIGKRDAIKVEVKPIAWTFQNGDDQPLIPVGIDYGLNKVYSYIAANEATISRRDTVPDIEDVLLLGAYPHIIGDCWAGSVALGVFLSETGGCCPDTAMLAKGYPPHRFDFHALYGSYGYRMGGQHEGDGHLKGGAHPDDVRKLWAEAGNTVQWKRAA
jgi:hypothetical protein